ncbi:MAG: hypothetical protein IJF96_04605 [Firmicutes bacterium]|nr:hypothetical protein [Bacillota bacterium]
MSKPVLTVLEGGLASVSGPREKDFRYAYVTDTRLMGVVGLYVHYRPDPEDHRKDWHQFFHLDAEEYGFDTYVSFRGDSSEAVKKTESSLFGGLGGTKVEVSFREASALLREYAAFNEKHGLELPSGRDEYAVLLDNSLPEMTETELRHLMDLQCVELQNEWQLINYFVMRCFGKDLPAAEYLSGAEDLTDIYPEYPAATLCKNTIDQKDKGVYLCESLIEADDRYFLVVTEVRVENMKVTGAEKCSGFPVSSHEAAIAVARSEFITVYDIDIDPATGDPYSLTGLVSRIFPSAAVSEHENGSLHMIFHTNNSHVGRRVYMLNDDICGIVFLSEGGQLLLASYDEVSIMALEQSIEQSPVSHYTAVSGKFKFKEPVLYEFMQGDFIDFDEFLEFIGAY